MKKQIQILFSLSLILVALGSCEEDIIIDTESGAPKVGIYGSITTDRKHHRITISRTTDFYSDKEIEMISDAKVFIVDKNTSDTFYLTERTPGIYETDSVAGVIDHSYRLEADLTDHGEKMHFYAESTIDSCPQQIDSIQIHKYTMLDIVSDDIYKVCPFFQTLGKNIYYMFDLSINDKNLTDTLDRRARLHLGAMSGLYYNGEEMSMIYQELNVYPHGLFYLDQTLTKEKLHIGDIVHITMYGIPKGYANYMDDIASSIGSNPLMGSPANVRTNIMGKEKEAVGYFYAASCIHFYQKISKLPKE